MAQVILTSVGQAVGGPIGAVIGSMVGRAIDQRVMSSLEPARQKGPRFETLKVQGTAEGAPVPAVFGRARVTGQIIWAARFLEGRNTSAGGKGGPRTTEYDYSLSFAVALCEGEIDGVGRVWADGRPMDLSRATMRVHRGGGDQTPDPLIEAVEGDAPAYRGVAYAVFEDLPLGPYGNRPPQLSFEIFRRAGAGGTALEDRLEGVCLIPGAGEFVLATDVIRRREGLTRTTAENVHGGDGRSDFVVSLDQLMAQAPALKRVSLVIGWFATDLRAAHCTVRPGVERVAKATEPLAWSVAGLTRGHAHVISENGGGPAYGGTPSDESVRQAVAEIKARGLEVTLYPFVFMDVAAGNGLPDPYGATEQAAYPWRGRMKGRDGAQATADMSAVFGAADAWGLRRLALHYAGLAVETGADGLLIGSEMRGLTWTRDADGGFPAVSQLKTLAAECRAVVGPDVAISYAADWSEYFGRHDGADVIFHLDPLWADANIDYVGIDWYPPLGDWRAEDGGVDGAAFPGPDDPGYLAGQVNGGEGFDWFYASDADRAAQARTAINDLAHGEHWVFRPKDLKGWWSHSHHDRPGGLRSSAPTGWIPGMKPIRLTEFGCAAVDRGGNAPNLFQDPKSSESSLPPFSTGARDDRMQRRALEAVLDHYARPENNPVSDVYGGSMLAGADAWCWDARPWPAFPGRREVWADAGAWRTGHWLNGRLAGETRDLIAAVLERGGLAENDFHIASASGAVQGYVIDRPMRTRDALEPLLAALGLVAAEQGGKIAVIGEARSETPLGLDALALPEKGTSIRGDRTLEARPGAARVRFIDGDADYQTGVAVARSGGAGGGIDLDLPAVCSASLARAAAERALEGGAHQQLTVALGPREALQLEPGDGVTVEGHAGGWRVMRLDVDETPSAVLERVSSVTVGPDDGEPSARDESAGGGAPFFRIVELPPLIGKEADDRPIAFAAAEPWRPMRVFAGASEDALTVRGDVARPVTVGVLTEPLKAGPRHRWDPVNSLAIRIEGRAPESRSLIAVFAGGNAAAVETADGWELLQFRAAELIGEGVWRLGGLLRGQQGTDGAMATGAAAGAVVVLLDVEPARAESTRAERGLPLIWRAGPAGAPAGGPLVTEVANTSSGVHDRPWSPAHLRSKSRIDGGFNLTWIPRARIDGDRWDGEPTSADPKRFRIRILAGTVALRTFEAEGEDTVYTGASAAADFPGGPDSEAAFAVSQWGEGYGWGAEAKAPLG
ncbi:baseplate multidomain protein megatron [Brevundimonas sp.]|uniref:baseplate multidomain protein megatron n=1 Tax=Brevundimonas sp. TaxID=1871086 RepID=UPI003FA5E007